MLSPWASNLNYPRQTVAGACVLHAKELELPATGELAERQPGQILWAFAGGESSFGDNCAPRHEKAYCRGGRYYDATLTKKWGCLAHCSYGPWQVLFVNYGIGYEPPNLIQGALALELCILMAIRRLNIAIHQGATELRQLADAYNSGNFHDDIVPEEYITSVLENYKIAMPTAAAVTGGKS